MTRQNQAAPIVPPSPPKRTAPGPRAAAIDRRNFSANSAPVHRRGFLKLSMLAAAWAAQTSAQNPATPPQNTTEIIDANVSLSRWPLQRVARDDPASLARFLRDKGVAQAWAGSFDALLHKDLGEVNRRTADDCRRHGGGLFVPFGAVNPRLPDWEEELRRCHREHLMPGIRLHPNYHGYTLADPEFVKLLRQCAALGLIVQLALVMEDERMMHPLLQVAAVDATPLAAIASDIPGLKLVFLNALRTLRGPALTRLIASGDVSVEISMLEGVGGVGTLLSQIAWRRVLFGSHAPFFYWDAARLKLRESLLPRDALAGIERENARRLLPSPR